MQQSLQAGFSTNYTWLYIWICRALVEMYIWDLLIAVTVLHLFHNTECGYS